MTRAETEEVKHLLVKSVTVSSAIGTVIGIVVGGFVQYRLQKPQYELEHVKLRNELVLTGIKADDIPRSEAYVDFLVRKGLITLDGSPSSGEADPTAAPKVAP